MSTNEKKVSRAHQFFMKWSTISSGFMELDLKFIWKNTEFGIAKIIMK